MPYITFISLLLLATSGMFSLYRQLQMLQQNSYFLSRYFKWVSNSYALELAISAILYCGITYFVLNGKSTLSFIVAILLLAVRIFLNIKTHKKSIKKLVFTARVKRLYVTAILLLGIFLFGSIFSFYTLFGEVSRVLCISMSVVPPLITVIIWFKTYPIEKAVSKWYINDAKRF